jgi:hypothetical protein
MHLETRLGEPVKMKWTLARKILLLVLLVCALFVAEEAFYVLPTFKAKLFERRKAETQEVVNVAFGTHCLT